MYAVTSSPTVAPLCSESIYLGNCSGFAIHGGSDVTFDGVTTVVHYGSVGTYPGTSITGAYRLEHGFPYSATVLASQCATARQVAYTGLMAMTCTQSITDGVISGMTLTTGVYCSDTGTFSTVGYGVLTLDGQNSTAGGIWVFQAVSTVITGGYSSVLLRNKALTKNVYWSVGSSATIGLSSSFLGTILAYASITFGHDSVFIGRALAGAAVTFESGSSLTLP